MYKQYGRKKSKSKFQAASINVQFGKPIVDTHLNKNKKTLKKSKSRGRKEQTTKAKVEVRVLSKDLDKIKQEKK